MTTVCRPVVFMTAALWLLSTGCVPPEPTADDGPADDAPVVDDTPTENPPDDDAAPPTTTGPDSDGDGFSDEEEINGLPGTDPMDPNDTPLKPIDSDGDGCSDFDEENFVNFCDNDPQTDDFTPPVDADRSNEFLLTVARQETQPFDEALVDAFFTEASFLLQSTQFECSDIPTDVTFTRDGPVTTFQSESAVISTSAQLDAVFDVPADFKIISSLLICGSTVTDASAQIVGCSTFGDSVIVIANTDPDVWVHEWGHVQGLSHRDDCARNIMHSFEVATNAVNDLERNAFLSQTPVNPADIIPPPKRVDGRAKSAQRGDDEPIEDWLHRVLTRKYRAGLPPVIADQLGPEHVAELRAMLGDPQLDSHVPNIICALGFARDPAACEPLINRIVGQAEEPTVDELGTLAEAFLALGRLVSADASDRAVDFLIEGTSPEAWVRRGIVWRFGSLEADYAPRLLARFSVMGLSVSSDPRSIAHLRKLQDAPASRGTAGGVARLAADQIREALARLEGEEFAEPEPSRIRVP